MRGSRASEGLVAQPGLASGDEQRPFGWITLHPPLPVHFAHLGVVRAVGRSEGAFELHAQFAVDLAAPVSSRLTLRRVSGSREAHPPAGRDDDAHRHLVLRQRAGLVARDHAGRAERLDGREVSHDRVALRHALHAEREHGRHDRRETFRHCGDRQRDAEDEDVHQRGGAVDVFDEHDRHDHHDGDRDDDGAEQLAGAIQLALEGCRLRRRVAQHPGDAPHLRLHPRRRHDGGAASEGRGGSLKEHVGSVADRRVGRHGRRVL
jgi:hypothetical protein